MPMLSSNEIYALRLLPLHFKWKAKEKLSSFIKVILILSNFCTEVKLTILKPKSKSINTCLAYQRHLKVLLLLYKSGPVHTLNFIMHINVKFNMCLLVHFCTVVSRYFQYISLHHENIEKVQIVSTLK